MAVINASIAKIKLNSKIEPLSKSYPLTNVNSNTALSTTDLNKSNLFVKAKLIAKTLTLTNKLNHEQEQY